MADVTITERHISDYRPDPANARTHTSRNVDVIEDSLHAVGAGRSLVADECDNILAGNATIDAAAAAGLTKVIEVETDGAALIVHKRRNLDATQKIQLALADNRAAELATWDEEQLRKLQAEAPELLEPLFTDHELRVLLSGVPLHGATDPDEIPAARHTDIAAGDMFALGRHLLLCGNCTVADDVARLLGDVVPFQMVTDQPYGVGYDAAWRARAGVNRSTKKLGAVTNDDTADWRAAWALFPGDVAYVWHAGLKASLVEASLVASGFELRSQIIWAKDRLVLSRGDYHWQHEPCWYAVRKGAAGGRTSDRTQATLWSIPSREDSGHGHSTQKPVECMARPMRNHDAPTVYDPFCGSGTTLIAAEELGRTCYAIEIEPSYCQIAIDRWEAFTGQTAVKI
jgi:DNA modification methylase